MFHLCFRLVVPAVVLLSLVFSSSASAQRKTGKEDPALKERPVALKTRDNIDLTAAYYPSKEGKNAIPLLIVHEWKGQASPYHRMCMAMRSAGLAVLLVEYRGHGNSKQYTTPQGNKKDFNLATMGKRDVEAIVQFDLEEAKQFLKKENNEGRLNLNALVVMGVQEGAIMAAHWAVRDWKFPSVGRIKQGQDVKAVIYLSPEKNFNGLTIDSTLRDPNISRLPTMVIVGNSSPQADEGERLGGRISAIRKRMKMDGFELETVSTSLSGPALINEVPTTVPKIVSFIKSNVTIGDSQNEWIER